jgi:uncharacterized membrane protein
MKIKLTLLFSLCVSLALNAQCPVEEKLMGSKWVLDVSDLIGVGEFALQNQLKFYTMMGDSLQPDVIRKWRITPDCRYLIINQGTDTLIMDFTREGFLMLESKGHADEFGRFRPEDRVLMRQIPLSTTGLTGYLKKLKTDYPEIYYNYVMKAEQNKLRRIYANQYQISQDSANAVKAAKNAADAAVVLTVEQQAAADVAAAAAIPASVETAQMSPATVDPTANSVAAIEEPYHPPFTDEMKNFKMEAGGGEPFWSLNVKDGFATFNAGDLPEYASLKLPITQFITQKIDKIEVKTIQFKDNETGIYILLMLSDNKKNKCSDGMSDFKFKYTVKLTILDKKYEGCGADK